MLVYQRVYVSLPFIWSIGLKIEYPFNPILFIRMFLIKVSQSHNVWDIHNFLDKRISYFPMMSQEFYESLGLTLPSAVFQCYIPHWSRLYTLYIPFFFQ